MKKNRLLIPNSTQIPNAIIDSLLPRIPDAEAKCMIYICRRTFGFGKTLDRISLSQFVGGIVSRNNERMDYGAGLSKPPVIEALRNLVEAKAILIKKGSVGNSYKINLNMDIDEVVKKVNQLRKYTRSSKASLPHQVKLLNLQNKGKQRETKDEPFIKNYGTLNTLKPIKRDPQGEDLARIAQGAS